MCYIVRETIQVLLFGSPKNVDTIKDFLKTSHTISRKPFRIQEPQFDGLIKRLLASDGATVICPDGTVKYYGCIIKMEVADNKTLRVQVKLLLVDWQVMVSQSKFLKTVQLRYS